MASLDELERRRAAYLTYAAVAETRSLKTGNPEIRNEWQSIELSWLNMAEAMRLAIAARRKG